MNGYTPTFSGTPQQPAAISYASFDFTTLYPQMTWPTGLEDSDTNLAYWNDIASVPINNIIYLPDATQVSPGAAFTINNSGSANFFVYAHDPGSPLATIPPGIAKFFVLTDNTSIPGTWRVVTFGAGTSSAAAAQLAGAGLAAISGLLAANLQTVAVNASTSLSSGNRAQIIFWTGGAGTLTLPTAASVATPGVTGGFFFGVHNLGTGGLVIQRASSDTIDGGTSVTVSVGNSCLVATDGASVWATIGLQGTSAGYTALNKNVAAGGTITLTTNECASQVQQFTGALASNTTLVYNGTVNYYFVYNNTTAAHTLTFKASGGDAGVAVTQGTLAVLSSDSVNMRLVAAAGTGTVTSIVFTSPLTGGTVTGTGTVGVGTTGAAGTYGGNGTYAQVVVDTYGRITAGTNISALGFLYQAIATAGTGTITGTSNVGYFIDGRTVSGSLILPGTPGLGDGILIIDQYNVFGLQNFTVTNNGNAIMGLLENMALTTPGVRVSLNYSGTAIGWQVNQSP